MLSVHGLSITQTLLREDSLHLTQTLRPGSHIPWGGWEGESEARDIPTQLCNSPPAGNWLFTHLAEGQLPDPGLNLRLWGGVDLEGEKTQRVDTQAAASPKTASRGTGGKVL